MGVLGKMSGRVGKDEWECWERCVGGLGKIIRRVEKNDWEGWER